MSSCTSCGATLGVGRFCTNCGAAVDSSTPDATPVSTPVTAGDWRTDTAERLPPDDEPPDAASGAARDGSGAPADARTPPAAVAPPPPPRYPLYADQVDSWKPYGPVMTHRTEASTEASTETSPKAGTGAGTETRTQTAPGTGAEPVDVGDAGVGPEQPYEVYEDYDDDYEDYYDDEGRRSPVLWVFVMLVVLALLAAGWWFLVRDDGSGGDGRTANGNGTGQAAQGIEVAGRASARAPDTAPPNEDVDGQQVSYDASNMLDGVPETAWRVAGNATGMELTFTLREPTELQQVGLLNGYAKTSTDDQGRTFDWYLGNRRINAVVWVFDDGSKVRQQLQETRDLQTMTVEPVVTSRVVLRLVRVSKPGTGKAARDFTAISEVSLAGIPQ